MNGPQEPQVPVWQQWLENNQEGTLEGLFKIYLTALDSQFRAYSNGIANEANGFRHSCGIDGLCAHAKAITSELFSATTEFLKREVEENKKQEAKQAGQTKEEKK